jgi:hypothetical protein
MKHSLLPAFLLFLSLFSPSCKKKQGTGVSTTGASEKTAAKPPALIMARDQWPQNYWTAKAKVSLKHPKMNVSFSMTLRSEKNKRLWFSAQAFGLLEVARGLISGDSLKIWDKFNNRCLVGDMQSMQEFVPVPMGIAQLQYFLMGRIFWDSLSFGKETRLQDSVLVSGENGSLNFQAKIWQKYLLHTARAAEAESKTKVYIENQDFKPASQMLIPWKKVLLASSNYTGTEEKTDLQIEFSKFEFSAAAPDFSLEVPAGCQRQVLR